MKLTLKGRYLSNILLPLSITLGFSGCAYHSLPLLYGINQTLSQRNSSYREPSIGIRTLAFLTNFNGKERIEILDLRNRRYIPLSGLNRPDSQPISLSVSADGKVIAFVRQRDGKTELLLYRSRLKTIQRLDLTPNGVPRRVSLDGLGKVLAIQVSRNGKWDIDILRLGGSL